MLPDQFNQPDQIFCGSLAAGFLFNGFENVQIKGIRQIAEAIVEGDQMIAGKPGKLLSGIEFQSLEFLRQHGEIVLESIGKLGIADLQLAADIFCHGSGVGRGKPDVGVVFMVMSVVRITFLMVVMGPHFQKGNIFRRINNILVFQNVFHKFLQPCAGEHNGIALFQCPHLPDTEGVVVQAGYIFRHQPGDRQGCSFAQRSRKFPHRGSGCGDLCRVCFLASCQAEKGKQKCQQ